MTIIGRFGLIAVLGFFSLAASAQVFKCKQPDGSYAYQGIPCQGGPSTQQVIETNRHGVVSTTEVSGTRRGVLPPEPPFESMEPRNRAQPAQETRTTDSNEGRSASTVAASPPATDQAPVNHASDLAGLLIQCAVYAVFAALIGWWANARNRSFWSWFTLSMLFTPGIVFWFFLFRGRDPA